MRNTFAQTMNQLAEEREDICLLSGDIGNRMFDKYKEIAPDRFLNCGIAEANMMSMAAGMALNGMRPIIYTITPFTTLRCLEQIRVGVAYHNVPVIIVGTGSGLSYAELGATHHSLEDMAVMRSIPNIQVCAPTDSIELKAQLIEAIDTGKPTYIRIGKKGEPDILKKSSQTGIGKAHMIKEGRENLLLAVGPITAEALEAQKFLSSQNKELAIAAMGSIKPLDERFLEERLEEGYRNWITLEEHHKIGGLGTTIIEWLSDRGENNVKVIRIGVEDKFINKLGNQIYSRKLAGIDSNSIINLVNTL